MTLNPVYHRCLKLYTEIVLYAIVFFLLIENLSVAEFLFPRSPYSDIVHFYHSIFLNKLNS